MNFLMKFFEARVNKIGTAEDKAKMADVISRWNSEAPVSVSEGIAIASKEAVVEKVAPVLSKKELKAKAKAEKELAVLAKQLKTDAYQVAQQYRNKIAKGLNVEANKKELAELEALIAEFKTMTDNEVVAKCQTLVK